VKTISCVCSAPHAASNQPLRLHVGIPIFISRTGRFYGRFSLLLKKLGHELQSEPRVASATVLYAVAYHGLLYLQIMLALNLACVKSYVRKLVLQYRYGLLPTYKLHERYKKTETSLCPLCGEEDSGHHAMSGCSKLLK
jgi:hypothetical protein